MKKLLSISLICSMLMTAFSFAIPLTWYTVNYDYIRTELCVNRHILGSDCNGSCQLKKKIDHHQDHDSSGEAKSVNNSPRIFLFYAEAEMIPAGVQNATHRYNNSMVLSAHLFSQEPSTPPPQIG